MECQQPLEIQGTRRLAHWGLSVHTELDLPLLHCSACNEVWESVPVTYDSFGNAPKQPNTVFGIDLLQQYRRLSKHGVSASNFCAVLTDMQALGEMAAGVPLSGEQFLQTLGFHCCGLLLMACASQ